MPTDLRRGGYIGIQYQYILNQVLLTILVSWVRDLIPAQREAITSVGLEGLESYWDIRRDRWMSLKKKDLRNLKHCYISLHSQKQLKSYFKRLYPQFIETDERWVTKVEQLVKAVEGEEMIVILQNDSSSNREKSSETTIPKA
jgi:hypothetical protein